MTIHFRDGSTTEDARFGRLCEVDPRTRRYWPEWPGWAVVDDWLAGNITVPVRDAALVEPVE